MRISKSLLWHQRFVSLSIIFWALQTTAPGVTFADWGRVFPNPFGEEWEDPSSGWTVRVVQMVANSSQPAIFALPTRESEMRDLGSQIANQLHQLSLGENNISGGLFLHRSATFYFFHAVAYTTTLYTLSSLPITFVEGLTLASLRRANELSEPLLTDVLIQVADLNGNLMLALSVHGCAEEKECDSEDDPNDDDFDGWL